MHVPSPRPDRLTKIRGVRAELLLADLDRPGERVRGTPGRDDAFGAHSSRKAAAVASSVA